MSDMGEFKKYAFVFGYLVNFSNYCGGCRSMKAPTASLTFWGTWSTSSECTSLYSSPAICVITSKTMVWSVCNLRSCKLTNKQFVECIRFLLVKRLFRVLWVLIWMEAFEILVPLIRFILTIVFIPRQLENMLSSQNKFLRTHSSYFFKFNVAQCWLLYFVNCKL